MRSQHLQIEGNAMAYQEGQDGDEDNFYLKTAFVLVGPITIYRLSPENIHFGLLLNTANTVLKTSKS